MLKLALTLTTGLSESATVIVKSEVPVAVGVPLIVLATYLVVTHIAGTSPADLRIHLRSTSGLSRLESGADDARSFSDMG